MIESPDMGGSSRSWASQRATRTQAMPTKSLFGSILEMTDEKQLQEMKAIDLAKYEEEKSQTSKWTGGSKTKVHFRDGLPGVEFLKERRGQFTRQSGVAQKTQEELNFLEEKSKYFQLGVDGKGCQNNNGSVNPNPWFSENDLKNAKEMNNVQAYGNHKRQPVKHNYSLIGDMFSPGMEFIDRENKKVIGPEHYKRPSYGRGQKGFNQTSTVKSRHNSAPPSTAMDLPPNIRHLFGTKICEHLLSDKNKVEKTMTDQQQLRDVLYRKNKGRPDIELPTIDADPQYEALGNALRTNVFPGFTFDNKISTTKKVYSREVHNSRQPDPDEFRYQRDHLTTWNEHNELQKRLRKRWDAYEETLPKYEPNWDRGAKRPPAPPAPTIKPKAKPKKVASKEPSKEVPADVLLEDIEFVTPPLTPLHINKPPPLPAQQTTKDDEFWDFYDQPLPLP